MALFTLKSTLARKLKGYGLPFMSTVPDMALLPAPVLVSLSPVTTPDTVFTSVFITLSVISFRVMVAPATDSGTFPFTLLRVR